MRKPDGFTFIELLVAISFVALLVASFKPYLDEQIVQAKRHRMVERMLEMADAAELYRLQVKESGLDSNGDYYRVLYELPSEGPNQIASFNQRTGRDFPATNFAGNRFGIRAISDHRVEVYTTLPNHLAALEKESSYPTLGVERQGGSTYYFVGATNLSGNAFYLRRARFMKRMLEEKYDP